MFEHELTLYEFNLRYLQWLMADIDDADLAKPAFPGGNPPVWILGHLAICTDYAARLLGGKPECPREWHKQFAPGTNSAALEPPLPGKAELLAAIANGHARVAELAPGASSEAMNAEHAIELLKPTVLKTNGDVVAHLMCTHPAFHLAQLSACRRAAGKGPLV